MLKFTEEGQGYWDFILDNCSEDFVQAIERDLLCPLSCFLIVDVKKIGIAISVYLKGSTGIVVHTEYLGTSSYYRDFMSSSNLSNFRSLGVL